MAAWIERFGYLLVAFGVLLLSPAINFLPIVFLPAIRDYLLGSPSENYYFRVVPAARADLSIQFGLLVLHTDQDALAGQTFNVTISTSFGTYWRAKTGLSH